MDRLPGRAPANDSRYYSPPSALFTRYGMATSERSAPTR